MIQSGAKVMGGFQIKIQNKKLFNQLKIRNKINRHEIVELKYNY